MFVVAARNCERSAWLLYDHLLTDRSRISLRAALTRFDRNVPELRSLRNKLEHFDAYLTGTGRMQTPGKNPFSVLFHDEHDDHQWNLQVDGTKLRVTSALDAICELGIAVHFAFFEPEVDMSVFYPDENLDGSSDGATPEEPTNP